MTRTKKILRVYEKGKQISSGSYCPFLLKIKLAVKEIQDLTLFLKYV